MDEILDITETIELKDEIIDIDDEIVDVKQDTSLDEFSILKRYGEILTNKEYITDPAIERDSEIKKVMLTLFTPEKSPILVGKPGIGKTAIVEGLAYRIKNNMVPEALKNNKIIKINTVAMVGNISKDGNSEQKLNLLVEELEKLEKTILFIDETHTLMGNKENGGLDFANILKPALSRGNVKMIGATTTNEYDYFILKDKAFVRRLEKIEIQEPNEETTVKILMGSLPRIIKKTNISVNYSNFVIENIMKFIVNMTSEYNRILETASRYPDVCFLVLTKAFSFAIMDNSKELKFKHIWEAVSTSEVVYPDVLKKHKEIFKKTFEQELEKENIYLH